MQKRFREAEVVHRNLVQLCRQVLGIQHQHTLISIAHLADNQYEQGRYAEAEKLQSEVLRVFKQIHGHRSPHSL